MGEQTLNAVKPRLTDPARHAADRSLSDAADAVERLSRLEDTLGHLLAALIVEHGEGLASEERNIGPDIVKIPVVYAAAAEDMSADGDAEALKGGQEYAADGYERSRHSA